MQSFDHAVFADQVVIADRVEDSSRDEGGMTSDVHVGLDSQRLVVAHQGPLDEIISLAVTIKPLLFGPTKLAQERVVRVPDALTRSPRFQLLQGKSARIK